MATKKPVVVTVTKTRTKVARVEPHDGPAMTGAEAREGPTGAFDAYPSYLSSPAYTAKSAFDDSVMGLKDLRNMQLSLTQAADLIAADMWLSGDIAIEFPESESPERNDDRLMDVLRPQRAQLVEQLSFAVSKKTLGSPPWFPSQESTSRAFTVSSPPTVNTARW